MYKLSPSIWSPTLPSQEIDDDKMWVLHYSKSVAVVKEISSEISDLKKCRIFGCLDVMYSLTCLVLA